MRRVILESPYEGDCGALRIERNLRYLRACMRDSVRRGEAPFASHAMYPQPGVLDDLDADDRELGMQAGFAWRASAAATVVYVDFGITKGMQEGITHGVATPNHVVEFREFGHEVIADIVRSIHEGADHPYATARWGWTQR